MNKNACNNGENVVGNTWSSDFKKQQKRPKRGPGVAELEKILRERESINISDIRDLQQIDATQNDHANAQLRNLSSEHSAPTMEQFFGTPTLLESSSMRLHNDHSSNQNSHYNYTSRIMDEHKMIGMKRSHSLTLENSLIPPSNFHVLPSFSHYNGPHQSSMNDSYGVSTYNSTNECYRDANWGRTLNLGDTRYNSDIVVPCHANFPPFATADVPSPHMHMFPGVFSRGNMFPYQITENKMDSYQHSESSVPDDRPFYNFLEVEDLEGETDDTNREAGRGVVIDLNLKL